LNDRAGASIVSDGLIDDSIAQTAIPGGWTDRSVAVGPFVFQLWTPADPDELLNQLDESATNLPQHLADPYWAKLWPAAPLLAVAVVRNPPARGTRVLELGSGSGLVGIAALAAGLDVTFSDYVPLAVELALANARRNGFKRAKGAVLDWRSAAGAEDERFELILAADVTYDRVNLDPLLDTVDRRLVPAGQAWFGDAGRSPAADFVTRAAARGWWVSLYDEHDVSAIDCNLGSYRRIVLTREQC
jgi:predicted nicotinamide N-methyase